jgi:hypothetical protein
MSMWCPCQARDPLHVPEEGLNSKLSVLLASLSLASVPPRGNNVALTGIVGVEYRRHVVGMLRSAVSREP